MTKSRPYGYHHGLLLFLSNPCPAGQPTGAVKFRRQPEPSYPRDIRDSRRLLLLRLHLFPPRIVHLRRWKAAHPLPQTSSLRPLTLHRKHPHRHLTALPHDARLNPQPHQRAPHHACGEPEEHLRPFQRLSPCFGARSAVYADAGEWGEAGVGEDVDAAVVCFEVVDGFAVEEGPEVFADEFDGVQR